MRKAEHSNIAQIKYFMVLVQEMTVQADKGFINAMIEMFTNDEAVIYGAEEYGKDLEITHQKLNQLAAITSSTEQKAYYEHLHFSPMKIHLSFSQGGGAGDDGGKSTPIHSEVLNLLLKSVGVTLTEIQDVQFQLAYFERKAVFMNQQQLIHEAISHYTKQAIKQLYVLVLGLDIMGNPFGLIRDLSTGVETFFYEPIQGAILGPGEFAEGLALGIRGLFGGAVGGAAGAVSRITGTLGKGLAALTLDEEYQKKRQQMLSRRPANVQEGLARGAKGLAMGFVEGVTGVFSKPIEGAKKEGVGGFAKGVGKGVVGLVTRPVSGVVDFASSSLQAVKRVTDTAEEVKKLRPARFIESDKIIRPFLIKNAEGNQLLQEASKGKFAETDVYVAHAPVTADKQFYCVVTDQRIMMVSKTLGALEVDWHYRWSELAEAPKMYEKGLKVKLKEPKKKTLGVFGSGSQGKVITFADRNIGEVIAAQAKEAFERDQ